MEDFAIRARNLGKMYQIGARQASYRTIQESISEAVSAPFRRVGKLLRGQSYGASDLSEVLWALDELSFDINHGEVVGIVGRNGAGKSTLLKVLSRITKPTKGYADIRGRVGALLEVGTGFHKELTGRENIYLNGAVLGMTRQEIARKFDEIVDFAGVDRFIDTPVKHFSTGMELRLGFAVAAHLEPEILLVDEVLAVGDVEFQKKCLGKMSEISSAGRTVLFVSHNLMAVNNLCTRGLLLDNGNLVADGPIAEVIRTYSSWGANVEQDSDRFPVMDRELGIGFEYCSATLQENLEQDSMDMEIQFGVVAKQPLGNIGINFELRTNTGIRLARYGARMTRFVFDMESGINHFVARCEGIDHILTSGEYILDLRLIMFPKQGQLVGLDNAATIKLPPKDVWHTGHVPRAEHHGPTLFPLKIQRSTKLHKETLR